MSQTVTFKATFRRSAPRAAKGGPTLATGAPASADGAHGATGAKAGTSGHVARVARQLALAYLVHHMVERGELKDHAEAARRLGISRSRLWQVMGLMNLGPAIQEAILAGRLAASERRLRGVAREPEWEAQVRFLSERVS